MEQTRCAHPDPLGDHRERRAPVAMRRERLARSAQNRLAARETGGVGAACGHAQRRYQRRVSAPLSDDVRASHVAPEHDHARQRNEDGRRRHAETGAARTQPPGRRRPGPRRAAGCTASPAAHGRERVTAGPGDPADRRHRDGGQLVAARLARDADAVEQRPSVGGGHPPQPPVATATGLQREPGRGPRADRTPSRQVISTRPFVTVAATPTAGRAPLDRVLQARLPRTSTFIDSGHAGAANLSAVFVAGYTDPEGLSGSAQVRLLARPARRRHRRPLRDRGPGAPHTCGAPVDQPVRDALLMARYSSTQAGELRRVPSAALVAFRRSHAVSRRGRCADRIRRVHEC